MGSKGTANFPLVTIFAKPLSHFPEQEGLQIGCRGLTAVFKTSFGV
jgi:hypothetical protein